MTTHELPNYSVSALISPSVTQFGMVSVCSWCIVLVFGCLARVFLIFFPFFFFLFLHNRFFDSCPFEVSCVFSCVNGVLDVLKYQLTGLLKQACFPCEILGMVGILVGEVLG